MSDNNINEYIQKIIEPLYLKIQHLQKENQQLKRRVSILEANSQVQSPRSYMKNTFSRQSQIDCSRATKKQDDNRSQSGSKEKPGWRRSTKLEEEIQVSKQIAHHQKFRTKPPIPRMTSKTPTKGQQQVRRATSPVIEKKIVGGQNEAQLPISPKKVTQNYENINTPTKADESGRQFDDPSASNASKMSSIKLGKPTIYIQKQSKPNLVPSSPRHLPSQRSTFNDKQELHGSDVTQQNSSTNLVKSQLSINSDKKLAAE